MTTPIPILITCVGGTLVPSALRWLRDHSRIPFTVHGADVNEAPRSLPLLKKFHRIPMGDDPGYVDTLLGIAEADGIQVIVPWSDGEAFALATAAHRFRSIGCDVMTSPPEVMAVIGNKLETYKALADAGLPVPEYTVIESADGLKKVIGDLGYPERSVIIKPVNGRGGRGLFVLIGRDSPPDWLGSGQRECRMNEAEFADANLLDLVTGTTMVMPCLHEPVYDADVLARQGVAQATVIRRRNNPTGIPWTGNTICRNRAFEDYASAVAEVLKLDSAHDIDLMSDAEGNPALLEVNPRMSGSMAATLMAGIPFFDAALGARLGIELPVELPERDIEVLPDTESAPL